MKKKILLIMICTASILSAQIATDYEARYDFTNSELINNADPGNGDLTPSSTGYIFVNDRNGNANNALSPKQRTFNGITINASSSAPKNNFTFSFWYQHENDAVGGNNEQILQLFDNSGDGVSIEKIPGNNFSFRITALTNSIISTSIPALLDGNWHHLAWTISYDPSTNVYDSTVYVDDIIETTLSTGLDFTSSSNLYNSSALFRISPLVSNLGLRSALDDIRIYSRALSASEINELYNEDQNSTSTLIYVDIDATGNNDGTSWTDAYTSLNTAIDNAGSNDEIWVAEGVYTSTEASAVTTTFPIIKTLAIYGGFDGTETALNQRDFITHKTILSGDRNQNDDLSKFPFSANEPTRSDNSRNVVNISAHNVVLDGLSIQGGHNTATQFSAIVVNSNNVSNFTLTNSEVAYNYVSGVCAGIHMQPTADSNITITNNRIQYNSSNTGTGMYIYTQGTPTVNLTIANNLFNDNRITAVGNTFSGSAGWIRALSTDSTINLDFINNTVVNHQNDNPTSSDRVNTIFGITQENGTMNANVVNNIFWGNSISNSSVLPQPISSIFNGGNTYGNTTVSEENISQLGFNAFTNSPGSTSDPIFTDSANNNFTLQANSPAIDAGNNNNIPTNVTSDLAGNNRIVNSTVDLGAYEFDPSLNINDYNSKDEVFLYPNPTKSNLTISAKNDVKSVTIYSVLGKKVLHTSTSTIDVSSLKTGIYFITIKNKKGYLLTKRFIKE